MHENGNDLSANSFHEQWSIFQSKALEIFASARGEKIPGILWTSSLTKQGRVDHFLDPEDYIIQVWTKRDDPVIKELLEIGFKLIISNHDELYLDCGFANWYMSGSNSCSPYKGWQKMYENNPMGMASSEYQHLIMGGEAALWTETADKSCLDSRASI